MTALRRVRQERYIYGTMKARARWSCTEFAAITAVIAMLICGWPRLAAAQNAAGSVTALSGSASLQRAGSMSDVTVGMMVQTGDQIAVKEGGQVTITLNDSSILNAGSASTLIIDEQLLDAGGGRSSTKVRLLAGILRSVARHSVRGTLPNFEVHTPNAILAVRGTTFDTSYSQGQQRFGFGSCTEFTDEQTYKGTVGVKNAATPNGLEVSVPSGYETTVVCDAPPLDPGPLGMTGIPSGGGVLTATEPGAEMGAPPPVGAAPAPPPAPPPPPPSLD